jgi:hypothetical protein
MFLAAYWPLYVCLAVTSLLVWILARYPAVPHKRPDLLPPDDQIRGITDVAISLHRARPCDWRAWEKELKDARPRLSGLRNARAARRGRRLLVQQLQARGAQQRGGRAR